MLGVLLRAAPWPALLGLATADAVLGASAVAIGGSAGVRVLQLAFVLLGGAAACSLDEACGPVVEACPFPRGLRVAVRGAAAATPALVGAAALGALRLRSGQPWELWLQLVGCLVLGFVAAAVCRGWSDEPGEALAGALVLVLLGVLLIEPVGRRLGLFAVEGPFGRTHHAWGLALLCGLALLAAVVPERSWRAR